VTLQSTVDVITSLAVTLDRANGVIALRFLNHPLLYGLDDVRLVPVVNPQELVNQVVGDERTALFKQVDYLVNVIHGAPLAQGHFE
jgi:hypothetical protein